MRFRVYGRDGSETYDHHPSGCGCATTPTSPSGQAGLVSGASDDAVTGPRDAADGRLEPPKADRRGGPRAGEMSQGDPASRRRSVGRPHGSSAPSYVGPPRQVTAAPRAGLRPQRHRAAYLRAQRTRRSRPRPSSHLCDPFPPAWSRAGPSRWPPASWGTRVIFRLGASATRCCERRPLKVASNRARESTGSAPGLERRVSRLDPRREQPRRTDPGVMLVQPDHRFVKPGPGRTTPPTASVPLRDDVRAGSTGPSTTSSSAGYRARSATSPGAGVFPAVPFERTIRRLQAAARATAPQPRDPSGRSDGSLPGSRAIALPACQLAGDFIGQSRCREALICYDEQAGPRPASNALPAAGDPRPRRRRHRRLTTTCRIAAVAEPAP
jgi:hypothetical protein